MNAVDLGDIARHQQFRPFTPAAGGEDDDDRPVIVPGPWQPTAQPEREVA